MHIPVLQKEVLECLNPKPNENFVDCTIGDGGHTTAILKRTKSRGKVLGIELDPELYQKLRVRMVEIPNRLVLVNDSYTNLKRILKEKKFGPVHGILFDLGMSSWHLEESGRGFSFLRNEFLDMRYGSECQKLTASEIVNKWKESEIEKILREYGEERFAKRIAREIVRARKLKPIKTTFELVEIIKRAVPVFYHHRRIHWATKTFQALRIAVNDELNNLKNGLAQVIQVLEPEGRLAVISFHSLEDRIVKNSLKDKAKEKAIKIITKKPVRPSQGEIRINPSSRSAKLRAAIKTNQ